MKATFDNTVSILVKAYLNNELQHGDCEACAVGNIVHAAGFKKYNAGRMPDDSCGSWKRLFCTMDGKQFMGYPVGELYFLAKQMIEKTGYTINELAKVEFAFETAQIGNSDDEWMFNGLMAVLTVLAEIHHVDLDTTENARKLFVKI